MTNPTFAFTYAPSDVKDREVQFPLTGDAVKLTGVSVKALDIDDVITQVLENNITHLESLRSSIERAQRKSIYDVREFGDTYAASLFVGVEERVSYDDLLKLIKTMRVGLAARRVAAANPVPAKKARKSK